MTEVLARAYITVARVNDGVNGADAIHLALDNIVGSVPCNLLLQTFSPSNILYTTLTLYKGATPIDMGTPAFEVSSGIAVNIVSTSSYSIKYKIQVWDTAALTETVTFKVIYQGVEYRAVFTVNKLKPGDNGKDGKNGIDGCAQRMFRTDTYMAGETYHNDSESASNGLKFIDYMAEEDSTMATGWNIYQCKSTHTGAATWAADKSQWVKVAVNAGSAFFTNLIAKNAKVKLLTGAQMIATENDGTPVAGVVNGDYPLWVGDKVDGKAEEAPFRVSRAGKMYSKDADIEGKVTATSGKIGKFNINQGYLGNSELGLYLDDNEIIFNGDGLAEGLQTIIGAFFHAGQAGPYLGRFTNGRKISSGTNYGLYFAIANGRYNFAALGLGDIVMRGNVEGIALNSVSFTANNQSEIIDLSKGKYVVVNNRYSNNAVVLPSLLDLTMYLNPVLSDKPSFAFRLTIIADLGTNDFVIYGRNKLASGNSTPWNNENYPLLTTWEGQNWDKYELGAGDSMELMLVYDPSRTSTIGGFTTKWTARIINLQQ